MAYSECPVCSGTGYEIFIDEHEAMPGEKAEYVRKCSRCNGATDTYSQVIKERANIPAAFYNDDMSRFNRNIYVDTDGKAIDISKQMKLVDSFIEDFQKWEREGMGLYIFSGMKGSGKTFLASCICNSLISKYPMVTKFVSAPNLIELSQQGVNGKYATQYDRDPIELLCNCKLLVLDDLGAKTGGIDWQNDLLFRITDARMQQKLVTIYTSNIEMENLNFDDRVTDRIYKTSLQISLPEKCIRAREANEKKRDFLKDMGIL